MIYECPSDHICFSKDDIDTCAMKGCIMQTIVISPIDIKWFYKINKDGGCIDKKDLHMIIDDPNMPKDAKNNTKNIPYLKRFVA